MDSILFSIDNRLDLANEIITKCQTGKNLLSIAMGTLNEQKFSDGELCIDFPNTIRGRRVYLLTSPDTSDEIIKLQLAIDAAKRAAASEIIPILPYSPYARQDKKDQVRGPIGAKVMAKMLEVCGATSIITYDLHAGQIQGFFEIPVTHIEGKNVFDEYIASIVTEDTILCGPDAGSGKRVKGVRDQVSKLGHELNIVMMDKTRSKANEVDKMVIIGDVNGKDVIILDDMVDTAGTLCKAADVLLDNGAKSVRAIISHGVLSGKAYENIANSKLTELVLSNSLDLKTNLNEKEINAMTKIKTISIAEKISTAIYATDRLYSYETLKNNRNHG